jgi:Helix-destabilising protein
VRIRIKSAQIQERQIKRKTDGKAFTFREQQGLVAMGEETRLIVVGLTDDQAAYPPGDYELLDGSFYVDRNGHLALGRLALKPLVSAGSPATRQAA